MSTTLYEGVRDDRYSTLWCYAIGCRIPSRSFLVPFRVAGTLIGHVKSPSATLNVNGQVQDNFRASLCMRV
jgi:hypothetical protein